MTTGHQQNIDTLEGVALLVSLLLLFGACYLASAHVYSNQSDSFNIFKRQDDLYKV